LKLSVVAESGEPRDIHHFATLIGYGANAVHPYLAFDTIRSLVPQHAESAQAFDSACANFRTAVENGILKVMSKMGFRFWVHTVERRFLKRLA